MQVACRFCESGGQKMYANVTGEQKPAARERREELPSVSYDELANAFLAPSFPGQRASRVLLGA
jgi:hypothetical protein